VKEAAILPTTTAPEARTTMEAIAKETFDIVP
jgi:hypothetical protein